MMLKIYISFLFIILSHSLLAEIPGEQIEFFEKNVRPILTEHCYKCHSEKSKKVKGKLLLDSKAGWLKGGDSGKAVIIPGKPKESLLVKMINHLPDFEEMPTKYKMKASEIQAIEKWITMGAPDPRSKEISAKFKKKEFDLQQRKKWWAFQNISSPTTPIVKNNSWPRNDIDKFILAKLEAENLSPAERADKRTLIRRTSFILTGLPPSQKEIDTFLADKSPQAFEKAVDHLMRSKHFGEHWARHWMDIVRFAETKAFEADYTMPHIFEYRDYLTRVFNDDVPYDRFIQESLAGDLITPRYNKENGNNEALSGTGYLFLSDGQHGPPDLHGDEARIFDGVIDVVTKSFTGLTVACARCHDHKFDAITAKDYYSLYGILASSRLHHANIANPLKQKEIVSKLEKMKPILVKEYIKELSKSTKSIPSYIELLRSEILEKKDISVLLKQKGLNSEVYNAWKRIATDKKFAQKMNGLSTLSDFIINKKTKRLSWLKEPIRKSGLSKTFFDMNSKSFGKLISSDKAFGSEPASAGDAILGANGKRFIQTVLAGKPSAGKLSSREAGTIRSPDFTLDGPVSLYVKGKNASVHLIIRNYELVGKGPTTRALRVIINNDNWQKVSFATHLWKGEKAYIEIVQNGGSLDVTRNKQYNYHHTEDSYVSIKGLSAYNDLIAWKGMGSESLSAVPKEIAIHINQLLSYWYKGTINEDQAELLTSLLNSGVLENSIEINASMKRKMGIYRQTALQIPQPIYVRSMVEGTPRDEPVYIRGNHKTLSHEKNPRHFLDGISEKAFITKGSGRLEWAKSLTSKDNPLTARVMVNRLWHHVFGRGIVFSTNNFGKLGRKPSHPELLDFLARDFVKEGWSIKKALRKMVLSSTFQMSSTPRKGLDVIDPENELLQHISVRRMTAEMIRDNILATTGTLDRTIYGPSIPANVKGMPRSRAMPRNSGPIDGAFRRSIYQEIRRNFLPPFFMAFDMPNATESIGKRNITNVPAQSLALMNDEFVQLQAKHWAINYASDSRSLEIKINKLHLQAYSRPATQGELAWGTTVINDLAKLKKLKLNSPELWKEFCHIMINRKEFIYLF